MLSYKPLVRQTSNHHHWTWHAKTLHEETFKWFQTFHPGQKTTLCICTEQIWLSKRKCYRKNKIYFHQEEMLKMAWYSMLIGFWTCPFQWLLLSQYFAASLKILHLKTIARKCTNFTFFIWECQGCLFGIRIKFHMGRAKGRAKRGY